MWFDVQVFTTRKRGTRMKHLIIGAGTVGKATGIWLEAHNQVVTFTDIDIDVTAKLKEEGHLVTREAITWYDYDMLWVCTHEKDVESVLHDLEGLPHPVIIRSTTSPGSAEKYAVHYNVQNLFHIPEFLKEATAVHDMFNPDHHIIGATKNVDPRIQSLVANIFSGQDAPTMWCSATMSELVKLIANNWLATQISFWNEVNTLCTKMSMNKQAIADAVTKDKRISKYGSIMIGKPFSGMCLPKDLDALISVFTCNNIEPKLLKVVRDINANLE